MTCTYYYLIIVSILYASHNIVDIAWRIYIPLPFIIILEIFAKASKIFCHWFDLFVCCVNVWVSASTQ